MPRARLLRARATSLYRGGAIDELTFQDALDAQVAAGDWEAAADLCNLFGIWVEDYAGEGDRADALLAAASAYAGRVPYSPVAALIAHNQSYRLYMTGHAAVLVMWRGYGRIATGDPGGIDEMRDSAATLAESAHRLTSTAYHNLAEASFALGDLEATNEHRAEAIAWAERFDDQRSVDLSRAGQAESAYHAGDWDAAAAMCAALVANSNRVTAMYTGWTRGRIALARGDEDLAVEDGAAMLEFAERTGGDEDLFAALALLAVAHNARGESGRATEMCDRFLDRWRAIGAMASMASALCDLVPAITSQSLTDAATLLPDFSRWKAPLVSVSEARYVDAADHYREIGSRPLEAGAHLLAARDAAGQGRHADSAHHAEAAIAFHRSVGATLYTRQAEALLRTTA